MQQGLDVGVNSNKLCHNILYYISKPATEIKTNFDYLKIFSLLISFTGLYSSW